VKFSQISSLFHFYSHLSRDLPPQHITITFSSSSNSKTNLSLSSFLGSSESKTQDLSYNFMVLGVRRASCPQLANLNAQAGIPNHHTLRSWPLPTFVYKLSGGFSPESWAETYSESLAFQPALSPEDWFLRHITRRSFLVPSSKGNESQASDNCAVTVQQLLEGRKFYLCNADSCQ
jgi:hypothetical protein